MQYLILTLLLCGAALASKIEINDTLLDWFPPLYAFDDWRSCLRKGDKFCAVDAELYSSSPSRLFDVLKEYSDQELKHYNRSLIHRGVCISHRNTSASDVEIAQEYVNQTMQQYGLEAQVYSAKWCSSAEPKDIPVTARAMVVVLTTLVVLTIVATGISFVDFKMSNKFLKAFSLKNNWNILTYNRALSSNVRLRDLSSLDAIKVLGIQGVIISHVMFIHGYAYTDNPDYFEKIYDNFIGKFLLNTPLLLQAFFAVTGFITAYTVLISSEKAKLSIISVLKSYANRWFRLVPVAMFAIWFTMSWFPMMGSGPHWALMAERETQECQDRWWYYPLLINNFASMKKFCLNHVWYIAADMQLHIFGMIVLFVLVRYPRLAIPVTTSLVAASGIASGVATYYYNFHPIAAGQGPEVFRTLFAKSRGISVVYVKPWMNPGFFAGIATAFIHYNNQEKGIKLNEQKWFVILWNLAPHLTNVVLAVGVFFLADNPPPIWMGWIYATIDRILTSFLMCVFILGLVVKCKSPILTMFSWPGFSVLGKLSYSAFVVHFIILRLIIGSEMYLIHCSFMSMMKLYLITAVITYLLCIPLFLLIETPMVQTYKAIFESSAPPPKPQESKEPATLKIEEVENGRNDASA